VLDNINSYGKKLLSSEEGKLKIAKLQKMAVIADHLNCTMSQLAIAWCLKNTNISTVLMGASSASQIQENLGALRVLPKLTESIWKQLEDILENKVTPGTSPFPMNIIPIRYYTWLGKISAAASVELITFQHCETVRWNCISPLRFVK
jgi:hypothetical protein